jgi:hypothetical protein
MEITWRESQEKRPCGQDTLHYNTQSCSSTSASTPVQPSGTSCSCSCCLGYACSSTLVGYAPITSCSGADCSAQCRSTFSACPAASANGFLSASCSSSSSSSNDNDDSATTGRCRDQPQRIQQRDTSGGVYNLWSSSSTWSGSATASVTFMIGTASICLAAAAILRLSCGA